MPPRKVPGYGPASAGKVDAAVGGWVSSHAGRRPAPKSAPAQVRYVLRDRYKGSTKAMAQDYGVSQRTVQRWLSGDRNPLERTVVRNGKRVRVAGSPEGRRLTRDVTEIRDRRAARHASAAARRGEFPRVQIKGEIGPHIEGEEYRRRRTITRELSREQAVKLIDAYQRRDDAAVQAVLEDAYGSYFDRGRTPSGADIGQVDWIKFL